MPNYYNRIYYGNIYFLRITMTKNHTSSALHQRGKEIGLKITQTSLKSENNSVEEMILQDAEVFWQDYYVHKTQNILENKKEKNYILSEEQEK